MVLSGAERVGNMLSQTAEYALRAMASLAYQPDGLVPTPVLAEQTRVPANYLAKVLQLLSGSGLIVGRRGVGGGYRLAKPADEITMLNVVNAVDPIQRITSCPLGLPNHGGSLCPMHKTVDEACKAIIDTFGQTTLQALVTEKADSRPLCDPDMIARLTVSARPEKLGTNGHG